MRKFNRVLSIILACLMLMPSLVTVFAETKNSGVDGVTLSRASSYLKVGDTITLTATVSPSIATDSRVIWSTSDSDVVTVDGGVVTAVSEGTATVTATTTDGGFKASCELYISKYDIRTPITSPTPDKNSGAYITDILDEDKFMLLLPFDDNVTDVSGNFAPVAKNTVTYANGIHGKAIQFGSGYVEVPEIEFGTKTVSFATWVKKTGASKVGDPGLFGTQNWSNGNNPGFVAFWSDARFGFNMANGTLRCPFNNAIGTILPSDIYDGWTHIAYVLDRESKTITLYSDFKYLSSMSISGNESISLDSSFTFKIGADGSVTYGIANAQMDDFFVYDGVLTENDIKRLAGYYGFSDTVPTESISIDERAYLLAGDSQKLVATISPSTATLKTIEWTTSNESVATVENGVVTAVSEGLAIVTATTLDGGFKASCKVYVTEIDVRNMGTSPTPDKNSGEYITDILDEDKFMLLLPFDDNVTDVSGNFAPVAKDTVTYANGIHGKAIQFGSGYVEVPEIKFGTKTVSFATWVKKTGASKVGDPGLFGTQNWSNGNSAGFVAFWRDERFGFNMADGTLRCPFNNAIGTVLPTNIYDGWTHIAYVLDRESKTITLYSDFKYVSSMSISGNEGISLDNGITFKIGTDGFVKYGIANAQMDDFFVYDGVLTDNDMKELAEYYGIKPVIPAESIALDRNSLYINTNEEKMLTTTVFPENATLTELVWSSSDDTIATVDSGVIKGISVGETDITVSNKNGDLTATCKVVVNNFNIRDMGTSTYPDKYITDIFDEDKFMLLLPFENNAEDVTENQTTTINGTINYGDGFYGKAARFNNGCVEFPELTLGTDNVTFGMWLKFDEYASFRQDTIFSTREISESLNPGFVVYATNSNISQMFSEGTKTYWNSTKYGVEAPADTLDGWVHLAYTIDRTNKAINVYYDFKLVKTFALTDESAAVSFDGIYPLRLGTLNVAEYLMFKGAMDDFFVYDGVLSSDDINKLQDYYNASGITVSVEDVKIDRKSAYLCPTETIELSASILPTNATHNMIEWSSSDESVATVEDGLVVAVAEGVADITATTVDGGFNASCRIYVKPLAIRNHESVVNPYEIGKEFVTDLFEDGKFKTFLTFENNAKDVTENQTTTVNGTINYSDGFYGRAAKFNNGCVEFPELTLGTDNVTFGMWLKFDEYANFRQDTIFSTREISESLNPGFVVYATSSNISQMFSEGTKTYWNSTKYGVEAPADTLDGWVHLAYTIDRTNKAINVYYDFKLVKTFALTDESAAVSFDGIYPLRLGTLNVAEYLMFKGTMDDFFIYNGVMNTNDMQTLKEYYGLGETVSVTGISLSEKSLELDINESAELVATVLPLNSTHQDLVWKSSSPEIATINNGKLRAESSGVTTITATTIDGGFVAECEVTVTDTITRFIYDNVVIIGLDGGGAFFKEADMPNVDKIFANGATTYTAQTEFPSISCQCWASMLHGIENGYHGRNNSNVDMESYPEDSPYPSIFKLAYEKYPNAKFASISDYTAINDGIIENSLPVHKDTGTVDEVRDKVVDYVKDNVPKLLFVQLDKPDAIGHLTGYGPASQDYLDTMNLCDGYIGDIYKAYEEQGVIDSTLFIVSADHGGTPTGNHGGSTAAEMNIFIGVAGRSVENGTIVDAKIRDISAIVAYALGIDIPDTWTAKVPDGVFEGVSGMERNVVPFEASPYRAHITQPTPSVDSGNHLTDMFDKDKFEFVLEFDESVNDVIGNHTNITTTGTITYEDGYFGKSAKFDEGYLTVEDFYLENENITIGTWIKARDIKKFGVLFSTGGYSKEGFNWYMNLHNFGILNTVEGKNIMHLFSDTAYYPIDFYDGWMHVAISIDKTRGRAVIYKDFKPWAKGAIPQTIDFKGLPLTIGMDSAAILDNLTVSLDDFFLYNEAMSDEDVAALSEYYAIPEDVASLEGASLVLDGQIGIKVYADIDEELTDRAELKVVRVNSDYECDADSPEYSTIYRVEETAEFIKDDETGKLYTILYAPAKDVDNISFEAELIAYSKKAPNKSISSGNATLSFDAYIEAAKKLASDGDEAFVEALPLIEALERYSSYADNFFNKGSLEDYTTVIDTTIFAPAQKSDLTLVGAKLYGTSLLLEDNVTIRHYFEVTDLEAFDNSYDYDIQYKTKGNYIYFDIEDINAQDIGEPKKLVLNDKNSNEVFTVTYSVGNYIVSACNSNDTRLASLVHAMYDYYVAANRYVSSVAIRDVDETEIREW